MYSCLHVQTRRISAKGLHWNVCFKYLTAAVTVSKIRLVSKIDEKYL